MSDPALLCAKFGPLPLVRPLHPPVVFGTQLVACVALLVLLQPPFVLNDSMADRRPQLCLSRVFAVSVLTTGTAMGMAFCNTHPSTAFRGACELVHNMAAITP
jgi:hypothetical protein